MYVPWPAEMSGTCTTTCRDKEWSQVREVGGDETGLTSGPVFSQHCPALRIHKRNIKTIYHVIVT